MLILHVASIPVSSFGSAPKIIITADIFNPVLPGNLTVILDWSSNPDWVIDIVFLVVWDLNVQFVCQLMLFFAYLQESPGFYMPALSCMFPLKALCLYLVAYGKNKTWPVCLWFCPVALACQRQHSCESDFFLIKEKLGQALMFHKVLSDFIKFYML